ncbi:MAG: chromate transporter [Christensenellaceae bacterium]
MKKYLLLFFDFFKIGLFTFGGGYAMISMMSHELVEKRGYIDKDEFSDLVAIAESTPGPIAINSATYIGYRRGNVFGAVLASLAVSLPSFIIIYLISMFLPKFMDNQIVQKAFSGIQCAVVILVINAAYKLIKNMKKTWLNILLTVLSALVLIILDIFSVNISTIYFVIIGGLTGFAITFPKLQKEKRAKVLESVETEKSEIDNTAEKEPSQEGDR